MAFAPSSVQPSGCFRNDSKVAFEFIPADTSWTGSLFDEQMALAANGKRHKYPNVELFMSDGSRRFAHLRKTCIWVCVGEDEDNNAIYERWLVIPRSLRFYDDPAEKIDWLND